MPICLSLRVKVKNVGNNGKACSCLHRAHTDVAAVCRGMLATRRLAAVTTPVYVQMAPSVTSTPSATGRRSTLTGVG